MIFAQKKQPLDCFLHIFCVYDIFVRLFNFTWSFSPYCHICLACSPLVPYLFPTWSLLGPFYFVAFGFDSLCLLLSEFQYLFLGWQHICELLLNLQAQLTKLNTFGIGCEC